MEEIAVTPLNGFVFVELIGQPKIGMIEIPKEWQHDTCLARVVGVGEGVDEAAPGDEIIINPSSHREIALHGKTLIAVHRSDILATITRECDVESETRPDSA